MGYLVHFAWFSLFGPPEWFQGVRQRLPETSSLQLGSDYDVYRRELDAPRSPSLGNPPQRMPPDLQGEVHRSDFFRDGSTGVVWSKDAERDHFRLWSSSAGQWSDVPLPPGVTGVIVVPGGDAPRLLVTRRQWWWPYGSNYGRFWLALARRELRPNAALVVVDPGSGHRRFLCAGSGPVASPDRTRVAFMRSERGGYHSIHVWRAADDGLSTVASVWEADPGSGPSFGYRWSADSRVLFVRGSSLGFDGSRPARRRIDVRLLYDTETDRLASLD